MACILFLQVTSICFDPEYDKWMGALAAGGHLAIEAWDVEDRTPYESIRINASMEFGSRSWTHVIWRWI